MFMGVSILLLDEGMAWLELIELGRFSHLKASFSNVIDGPKVWLLFLVRSIDAENKEFEGKNEGSEMRFIYFCMFS